MKQGGPQTPLEADELITYADGLKEMYPLDKELLAQVDQAMKLRKMVESE